MMRLLPKSFVDTLSHRYFLVLILVTITNQLAAAFLILSMIAAAYSKIGNNFGVSGVIVSFASPGFLLAFAGLFADLFDRRRIILYACIFNSLVLLVMLFSFDSIYALFPLSFLYFCGNAFFVPAATASSAQLVKKSQLLSSNSLFVFCLAGGQLTGFMLAAVVHFFYGNFVTMAGSLALIITCAGLSFMLPSLSPREEPDIPLFSAIYRIWKAFKYIFGRKKVWFFFVVLALMQGVIAFGVTLAPGFFDKVLQIPIGKSLLIVFPAIGLGALMGVVFVHNPKIRESRFLSLGFASIGLPALLLGIAMKLGGMSNSFWIYPVCLYLVLLGFGVIVSMIASRTVLQKAISHNFLGTVFGANTILAALFSGILSPFAAGSEAILGYVRLMILAGVLFCFGSAILISGGNKWKF